MTCASAVLPSWVMVTAMFFTPSRLAISSVAPDNFSVGLPLGSRTTSISTQRTPWAQPCAEGFHRGFFNGETSGEALGVLAMTLAIGDFRGVNALEEVQGRGARWPLPCGRLR